MNKTKDKNPNRRYKLSFILRFVLFSLLALCLSVSVAGAESSPEQFDPMDFLTDYLTEASQNDNELNVPIQFVKQNSQGQQLQIGEAVSATFGAQVDKRLPQDVLINQANSDKWSVRQLWQASVTILQDQEDKTAKDELQRIIKQIRSVQFKPPRKTPEPVVVVKPTPTTAEPNEIPSDTKSPEEPQEKEAESKLPYEPVSGETLQMLEEISKHPDQLGTPFDLGEVLFLSGHPKQAEIFYRQALNRGGADNSGSAQNRDWILFQIANCLREDNPPEALKLYRQLIAEYADSPWTELAKAQEKLIDWYQKDKPWMLITEDRQLANSR